MRFNDFVLFSNDALLYVLSIKEVYTIQLTQYSSLLWEFGTCVVWMREKR